jgi:Ni/Co efflux regulator RcnB
MTKTIMAAVLAATMLAAPAAYAQSSKGIPTISAQERQAQQAWWAARAQRHARQHMAACTAMPECRDGRMMPAASSNKG